MRVGDEVVGFELELCGLTTRILTFHGSVVSVGRRTFHVAWADLPVKTRHSLDGGIGIRRGSMRAAFLAGSFEAEMFPRVLLAYACLDLRKEKT